MRVIEAKSSLVFIVNHITTTQRLVIHAQLMVLYLVAYRGEQAFEELKQQAAHYDTTYHLVEAIRKIRKKQSEYEVLRDGLDLSTGNMKHGCRSSM